MTNTIKNCNFLIAFFLGAVLVTVLALFLRGANQTFGDQPGSLPANQSTTTNYSVLATDALPIQPHIATSTTCSARIINTGSSTVRMIMTNKQGERPTESMGIFQAASSTVLYGAQDYGCNAVWIRAMTGTSLIKVIETQ